MFLVRFGVFNFVIGKTKIGLNRLRFSTFSKDLPVDFMKQRSQASLLEEFSKHFPDYTWDFTPEKLENRSRKLIEKAENTINSLVKMKDSDICFKNVCEVLADFEAEFELERCMVDIYQNASVDEEVRKRASEINKVFCDFWIEISMRKDLYDLLVKVSDKKESLDYESQRYIDKVLLDKKRDGLHLPEAERNQLTDLFKQMSVMGIDFSQNIAEENNSLKFEKNELEGLPDDFFSGLPKEGDKYVVALKYPYIIPILKHCKVVKTRQTVEKAYNSRCVDTNTPILEKLVELRDEKRKILGYKTHVDFVTEILMSKSAAKVKDFLDTLAEKIKVAAAKEMSRLIELKKEEYEKNKWTFDGKLYPYDSLYYQNMVEERDYKVDSNVIREYFPFEYVTTQLMSIYQTLLGLKYEKIEGAKTLHPDISLYAVFDQSSDELMGYFYLDPFPRPGKYTHAACFGMQPSCIYKGKRQVSCAAMLSNFTKPQPDKPSLLTHLEVETYFHEFGHVMHHLCSQTKFSMFHGTTVERDFVEAPSQMLENWCWEKESLKKISCHYTAKQSDGAEVRPLPDDLIETICKSRRANISLFYARQISLAMFDYIIHTSAKANTAEVYRTCASKYVGYEPTPGTNFAAAFGHMAGGYDAQYYGYLWSQVYSYDMFFSRFKKEGVFSPKTGMDYRQKILFPGSTKDGFELLRDFLGRDPIMEPFLEIAGIK